jgi:hypothetical protein
MMGGGAVLVAVAAAIGNLLQGWDNATIAGNHSHRRSLSLSICNSIIKILYASEEILNCNLICSDFFLTPTISSLT